jgi:hypothetical protein
MMKPSLTTAALVVTQPGLVLGAGTPVELV